MNAELCAWNLGAHWIQAGVLATSALIALRLLHMTEPRAKLAALHLTLVAILMLPLLQPWKSYDPGVHTASTAAAIDVAPGLSEATLVNTVGGEPWFDPALACVLAAASGVAARLVWLLYGIVRLSRFTRRATEVAPPLIAAALEAEIGVSPRYILQIGSCGPWTLGLFHPTVALPSRFEALAPDFQRAVICHELLHIKRRDIAIALVEELTVATLWFHPWVWLLRGRIRVAREQVVDAHVVELLGNREGYVRCLVNISGHDLAPHFTQAGAGMLRPRELRARVDAIFQEARMSRRHVVFAALALAMTVGATTYLAGATLPMRSALIPDDAPSIIDPRPIAQAPGAIVPARLDLAISSPIRLQFRDARLRDVLAMIGQATSIVFTGYEASFDEARSTTIESTTIDTAASLEAVLDRLLTPSGLMYTVTGPRTVAIARRPLAELRQAAPSQTEAGTSRKQMNKVYPEYPQDALERGIQGTVVVDITVNAVGDVTTAAVASGPQELRASAFKAALALKYTPGPSTIAMKIGFHYTLSGTSWGVSVGGGAPDIATRYQAARDSAGDGTVGPAADPDATGAYRLGGDIRPPKKIKDSPPQYPPDAKEARVQGVVIMEARIDEQGHVSDVRTLRSIPLLDQAAIDAVKQWQYEPALRNGVAVPVHVTVTVNFSLRELFTVHVLSPDGTSGNVELYSGALLQVPGIRFHLRASRLPGSSDVLLVLVDDGQTHLGEMVLALNGPVVQSPTTPSFGLQLLGIR